jgi:hypothetical protein
MNRKILIMLGLQALIIVVLFWLLVFYGKDEYEEMMIESEEEIETQTMVAEQDKNDHGAATIVLNAKSQKLSGIQVTPLQTATHYAATRAFGSVVAIEGLVELRARYQSALAEVNVAHSSLANAQQEFERLQLLNKDNRNVSDRAVQAAESTLKSEKARLVAAETQVAGLRDSLRQQWGETLAKLAMQAETADTFGRLLRYQDVLVKVTLAFDASPDVRTSLFVMPIGGQGGAVKAQLVSAAPQADTTVQGKTYFYRAPADSLRVGMRVSAQLTREDAALSGVIVPHAAVVWFSNKAWVYQKIAADKFIRREINTDIEASQGLLNGWFNTSGIAEGDEVVTSGAQLLLSEELKFQIRDENDD